MAKNFSDFVKNDLALRYIEWLNISHIVLVTVKEDFKLVDSYDRPIKSSFRKKLCVLPTATAFFAPLNSNRPPD